MLDLYVHSKNSLQGLESALRIAISNANNFNTPGYKYTFASFTTVYSEAMSSGTKTINPTHTGSSMTLGSTSTDFRQGNLSIGTAMDVAIVGEGLVILSSSPQEFDPGSPKLYTRAGRFQMDIGNQYLIDSFGRKVFGYKVDENGNVISRQPEAIKIENETDVGFTEGGVFVGNYDTNQKDPTIPIKPLYRLALSTFQNKQGLVQATGGAYRATASSGEQLAPNISGGTIGDSGNVYGDIIPESLESSNVDVAKVALDMNLLNRGFSAVQAVIDDVTKILQNIISKIGGG